MIEHDYAITIVKDYIDGELMYKATVAKFPDMVVYDAKPVNAHGKAIVVIRSLVEMSHDMGHEIPKPDYVESMMGDVK